MSYYKSEKNFRRYESAIATVVEQFPKAVLLTPEVVNCTTYAARLSDAMTHCLKNDWRANFNKTRLAAIRKDLCITIAGMKVLVSPREAAKPTSTRFELEDKNPNEFSVAELHAICLLVGNSRMGQTIVPLNTELSTHLAHIENDQRYNISVLNNKDGTFTIL